MRKIIAVLFIAAWGLPLFNSVAWADGFVLPEMLGAAVRYHHVSVEIEDNHVVTRVEQEFYNPYSEPIEGRYLFPIPPQAILSDFRATVDGVAQIMTRQDAATTNAVLYSGVVNQQDPTLLQYADWESMAFEMTLPAGGARTMVLEYEEVLAPQSGLYHYRYILSTEQYSSLPVEDITLTVNLRSSAGLGTLYSPSHAVITQRSGPGEALVTWSAQQVQPTEDFDLFFSPAEGGAGGGLTFGRQADRDHFLFLFAPDFPHEQQAALPKDIIFVMDRSGSMGGEKIEQARGSLQFILGQLNPHDRFSIVGFDDEMLVFSPTLQPVTKETLEDARRFIDQLEARGNTDLERALQTGLAVFERSESRSEASRVVVFLTDGLPTAGYTDAETIATLVDQTNARIDARLHVFGVGYDVNTHLLDRLADNNQGSVTYVQPGENIERVLVTFYEKIATPLFTDVVVEFEGLQTSDLYPSQIPDMYQGSSILLTGLYTSAEPTITIRVRGNSGNQPQEFVYIYQIDQVRTYDFVPRLWATRQIGYLLDQVRIQGETEALVAQIRALGLSYGLVTPYTTYLIVPQTGGAASEANMMLYDTTNQQALNQASGQITVQARVQNQSYQQAAQANLATGANVINVGQNNLVQIEAQNVDIALLGEWAEPGIAVSTEWIDQNIVVDRVILFGSEEYFDLAQIPDARLFLQTGQNVLFEYGGEVIKVIAESTP
ncbi:MAG: VWA domain-containing protein [Chloroflexi bacterium]|nr:VWA domain-containing protein [Chloroflexota bacterium]